MSRTAGMSDGSVILFEALQQAVCRLEDARAATEVLQQEITREVRRRNEAELTAGSLAARVDRLEDDAATLRMSLDESQKRCRELEESAARFNRSNEWYQVGGGRPSE
jgi:hypothetical protein